MIETFCVNSAIKKKMCHQPLLTTDRQKPFLLKDPKTVHLG